MFRQANNYVKIEGILAETDLKYSSFVDKNTGDTVEAIGGQIKVLVDQEVNGVSTSLEIPVHMYSRKYTKAGGLNPSYESIEKCMKEFVSIAAAGSAAQADRIRITRAQIVMNEFPGQNGQIVSEPRIRASFVARAIGDFHPTAEFDLEFMVSSLNRAVDREGVELDPPKLAVQVVVPQYTNPNASVMNLDIVTLHAVSPRVIDPIERYWEAGCTYRAHGILNFSSRTEEVIQEVDFGEPTKRVRTINVREFIITGGSEAPLDDALAFNVEDVKAGIAARKQRLEDLKTSKNTQFKNAPAPAQTTTKGKLDLGF